MAKEKLITFQKFNDQGAASELADLLKENNVEYLLEDTSASFDPAFAYNELTKEFRIKLKKQDFEKANRLLQQVFLKQLDTVGKDYYLYDFTDAELKDIIAKRDEWGQFDFLLAQKLLKERGKEIKQEAVEQLKKQRIKELAKPDDGHKNWILVGYVMAFLGGLIGFFIGWHLLSYKKTLPNGDIVYGYSPVDRRHGKRILIISTIFFIVWVAVRILIYTD